MDDRDHILSQLAGVDHLPYVSVERIDGVLHTINRCLECGVPLTQPMSLIDGIHGGEPVGTDGEG